MNYRDEMEIDLLDLLYVILNRWRSIVVFMILGALAGGIFSYFKPETVNSASASQVNIITSKELNALQSKLDKKLTEEVLTNVEAYSLSKKQYDRLSEHRDKSIRFQIDPNKAPTMISSYIISDYTEDEYVYLSEISNADNIISLYSDALLSKKVIEEIRKASGYEADDNYIKELYSIDKGGLSLMKLQVKAPSKEECQTIMGVLEKNLEEVKNDIATVNSHKIKKVSEDYFEDRDSALFDEIKAEDQTLIDLKKAMMTVPKSVISQKAFEGDQKAYYDALIDILNGKLSIGSEEDKEAAILEKENKIESGNEDSSNKDPEVSTDLSTLIEAHRNAELIIERGISKKFILLGAIAGAFLPAAWYALLYILSGSLKTADEMTNVFKLTSYGLINIEKEGKKKKPLSKIDDLIEKISNKNKSDFSRKEAMDIICSGIALSAEKEDVKKLFITGSASDTISEDGKKEIVSCLREGSYLPKDCELDQGRSIILDPRALEKMAQSEGVVLVERLGASRYENINTELEMIKKYGAEVLGVVVLEG